MRCNLVISSICALTLIHFTAQSEEAIETIQITANKSLLQTEGETEIQQRINVDETTLPLQKVADALLYVPGVTLNGQGGLWQSYTIRGLARWRVKSMVEGIPINTDRRAGNALSFIDPQLLSVVDVVTGPSSVYYGSGAIGGVVNAQLKQGTHRKVSAGYDAFANERYASVVSSIDDDVIAGIAYRQAGNDSNQRGEPLLSQFEQWSGYVKYQGLLDSGYRVSSSLIASHGQDIGKVSNQYPDSRISFYPLEQHWLTKLEISDETHWNLGAYGHYQNWQSDVLRIGKRRNMNDYQSFDWGLYGQMTWQLAAINGRVGFDSDNRSQVKISESQQTLAHQLQWQRDILTGSEYRHALYTDANTKWNRWSIHVGSRFEYIEQHRDVQRQDQIITGFIKAKTHLTENSHLLLESGTGFRFPSLTERFFSGSTARAQVIGNPELKPESSVNHVLSYQLTAHQFQLSITGFYNKIDDYIERVTLDSETLTYRNETQARLWGGEVQVQIQLNENLKLDWSYQQTKGKNQFDQVLADIPPSESRLQLAWQQDDWELRSKYRYRSAFSRPASGEHKLDDTHIVDISGHYWLDESLKFTMGIANAFDESYFSTTDDNSQIAAGRHASVQVEYYF